MRIVALNESWRCFSAKTGFSTSRPNFVLLVCTWYKVFPYQLGNIDFHTSRQY